MKKPLILYYSFEGNTRKIAEYLAEKIDSDIEPIVPIKEMKVRRFGKYFWGGMMVRMKYKPELEPIDHNIGGYDTIILCSPIWSGTFAPPILSLLESGQLKNKRIGYIYTHEGGADDAVAKAEAIIEKDNTLVSSFGCYAVMKYFDTLKDEVVEWSKRILS